MQEKKERLQQKLMYQKDLSLSQGIYEDPIMCVKIQQANIISKKKKMKDMKS